MLFYNVLCVCFLALLAQKIETNALLNSDTEKPEALFADVIKNISRVNNELQDLINNYELFKKTPGSLENFDDHESDADGGRVNRNNKNSLGNKRDTTDKTSNILKLQTEMIYVDEKAEKSIETEKSSKSESSKEVEKRHEVEFRKPMEKIGKYKHKVQKTTTEESIASEEPIASKVETESENQEFLNIHKKMKINTDRKKQITPEPAVEQAPKKTKFFKKETQTKYLNHNSSESDSSMDVERHTENEELDVNNPKERAFEKDTDVTQVTAGIFLRTQTNESKITKKVDNDLSQELTDNDEALSKDLFKTSVLRQAYGDACLKLVMRKCYRACKSAYKSSCQAIKCKNELKKYFDKRSKTGCIDAFNASSSKEDNFYNLRRIIGPTTFNSGIMTRDGYLSMACQTQIENPTRRMSNNTKSQNGEQLNILRDRYERECQKTSQNKCGKACLYAYNATCAEFKCRKRLKKNFKKNCRTDCRIAYSIKAKKSSDSDDDSHTDSDDMSDDDEDDDDGDGDGDRDDDGDGDSDDDS